MREHINDLISGLKPIEAININRKLGEVDLNFGIMPKIDKSSLGAFISYMAIAQLDQYSDLKKTRSLYDIHESEHFMDIHLSCYFRRLILQSINQIPELIDRVVKMENVNLKHFEQTKEIQSLVFEHLVNRISFEREMDLAVYLLRNHYIDLFNRSLQTTLDNFYLEFKESNLEFDKFFFSRIDKVKFRFLMDISEYDIEIIHLGFMIAFRIPISYKRAIKFYTYLGAFYDLGRKNRIIQKFMVDDILNHGLDLNKQQNVVPDNPIEPEETKKRGPKL